MKKDFRIPLQRLFYLIGGEFKGFFSADRSEQFWAVQEWLSFDAYGHFRTFCGPGQCFWLLKRHLGGLFLGPIGLKCVCLRFLWPEKPQNWFFKTIPKTLPEAAKSSKMSICIKWESFLDCPELPGPIRRKKSLKVPPKEIKKSL